MNLHLRGSDLRCASLALGLLLALAGCSGDDAPGVTTTQAIDASTSSNLPDLSDPAPPSDAASDPDADPTKEDAASKEDGQTSGDEDADKPSDPDAPEGADGAQGETTDPAPEEDTQGPACAEGEGCFLDPCESNDDCLSGYCVEHMGNDVCTEGCESECPPGWSCKEVSGAGADITFLCVSDASNLCRPCVSHDDCVSSEDVEDACIDYGPEGNFCGSPCQEDGDCPQGFACTNATVITGATSKQCVYQDGLCPCSDKAINLGLETTCEVINDFGTCSGKRSCEAGGLGVCDAAEPAQDICNGEDDDCDGEIDEDGCDDGNPCTTDYCQPDQAEPCIHTPKDGILCNDDDACTLTDFCMEGVCTGNAKWCTDDNECTDDSCDSETGECVFEPNEGGCDDGDPCTEGDVCVDGLCEATPMDCQCTDSGDCVALEDGDKCNGTLICDTSGLPYGCVVDPDTVVTCPEPEGLDAPCLAPSCDPVTGACSFVAANEGGACDDEDACTVGDACVAGVCTGGGALNCNDNSECTNDSCDEINDQCVNVLLPYEQGGSIKREWILAADVNKSPMLRPTRVVGGSHGGSSLR